MSFNIPKTPQEFIAHLEKDRDSFASLRDEMNRHIGGERATEIRGKRTFLQNIVITSATLLGFISAFSIISDNEKISHPYFIVGVGLHLFLICFVTLYLRETIDAEIEGLVKIQDNYNDILKYNVDLAQRYLLDFVNNMTEVSSKFKAYLEEIQKSTALEKIKEENEKLDKGREYRMNRTAMLEFNGEIAIFCFVCGTILIFISVLGTYLSLGYLIFGLTILFYFTFTDSLSRWLKYIFKILTFITRKDLTPFRYRRNVHTGNNK